MGAAGPSRDHAQPSLSTRRPTPPGLPLDARIPGPSNSGNRNGVTPADSQCGTPSPRTLAEIDCRNLRETEMARATSDKSVKDRTLPKAPTGIQGLDEI